MKNTQTIVNDFLDNIHQYEDDVLEAIGHLIEVELQERDFMANPEHFKVDDDDVN